MRGTASREAAPVGLLQRDTDCNSCRRKPAVVQVITVIDIADIHVIIVVPVVAPVVWPRVKGTDPIALVLEARVSADNQKGEADDPESVARPKVSAETVVRNAIAVVATALLPGAVVRLPVL